MSGHKPFAFQIDLPVRNEWENIDLVRTSVQNCFAAVFKDIDGSHAVAMVTGELLENAMKYGRWSEVDNTQLRLRVRGGESTCRVRVTNPVDPDSPGVKSLLDTIEWLGTFDDAGKAYRARLIEIASADAELESSQLGLVRIAYEGACTLTATVDGDLVTVVAEMKLSS